MTTVSAFKPNPAGSSGGPSSNVAAPAPTASNAASSHPLAPRGTSFTDQAAQARRLATLNTNLLAEINRATTTANLPQLPTTAAFLARPVPPQLSNNPLHVAELREMITAHLLPVDLWSLSQVDKRLRAQMTPTRNQLAQVNAAIMAAMQGVLTANGAASCEDLHKAVAVQGLEPAMQQLRQAFGMPNNARWVDVLTALIRHLPLLPHARDPVKDVQQQALYFARAVLPRVRIGVTAPALNRMGEATLQVLPQVWPGRHFKPGEYASKVFHKVATPAADAADATCGMTAIVGLPLAAVAAGGVAAGSMVVKKGATTNRLLNLFREISRLMPAQGMDDALVQRVADTLAAHPGGRGKHLASLRNVLERNASAQQKAAVQAQLQAAGW